MTQKQRYMIIGSVVILLLLGLFLVKNWPTHSGNETSRLATIQSLVERGTFAIEESSFPTVDAAMRNGHFYSDKPYLLSVFQAGIYWGLYHIAGLKLDTSSPEIFKTIFLIYYLGGYLFLVGIFLLFFRMVSKQLPEASFAWRLGMSWAVVLTTLVFPYSLTIGNQVPAVLVLLWLVHALSEYERSPDGKHAALVGLAAGLLVNLEYVVGGIFGVAAFLLIFLPRHYRQAAFYSVTALAGLSLIPILNLIAHGSPLPLYSETHSVSLARNFLPDLWSLLFGYKGIFIFTPTLLFIIPVWLKLPKEQWPRQKTFILGTIALTIAAYWILTSDGGGWCYGNRFLLTVGPLMFYYIVLHLKDWRRDLKHWLFTVLLVWSFAVALIGTYTPWPSSHERSPSALWADLQVRNSIGGNLLAFSYEHAPDSAFTQFLIHRVYGEEAAVSYLFLSYFNTYNFRMSGILEKQYYPPQELGGKAGPRRQ